MTPIILPVPRRQFRTMLCVTLGLLLVPLDMMGSRLPGATVVACIGIVFLLACAAYCAVRLHSSAPMLVIDDTGVTDQSSLIGAGFLLWSDISRADITSFLGQGMLTLHLADTPAFLARMHPLKRLVMRINAALFGGAPVNLPLQALDMEQDALLAAVRARLGGVPG
jgi:hypothetical protein